MLNVVLFGPPGAGKGTQSLKLVEKYNLIHLSTGDIFRYNIKNNTDLGQLAQGYMNEGKLVPDEVTIKMLESELNKHPNAEGFIFDGFPRTTQQAMALDSLLATKHTEVHIMLALDVPEKELKERLKERALTSGRPDDANAEVIQKRINVYNKETLPVKEYYTKRDKFTAVHGLGTIEEVFERLCSVLDTVPA